MTINRKIAAVILGLGLTLAGAGAASAHMPRAHHHFHRTEAGGRHEHHRALESRREGRFSPR